jgi:transposase-like protein
MMMHLSRERTIFVCYQFFRQLRNRYGSRKPIFTDGAGWYNNEACKWLVETRGIWEQTQESNGKKDLYNR